MNLINTKIYTTFLQLSTVLLTALLVWFTFVYYPRVIKDYQTGNFPKKFSIAPASATTGKFPIETNFYRISLETKSNTYYAFIVGQTLDEFLTNRNGAALALKTALSLDNLCGLNVIYVSTAKLAIPQQFQNFTDCR